MSLSVAADLASIVQAESAFFFAGAGISIESNAPSVAEMLKVTSEVFLPNEDEYRLLTNQILEGSGGKQRNRIQPELLYEAILSITGDDRILGLWEVLSDGYLSARGYSLEPNANHIAMVKYSASARVPIFTTNFDGLFEKAAGYLGVPFEVILPYTDREQQVCRDLITSQHPQDVVYIFKLHGSSDDLESVRTTMQSISSQNREVLDLLDHLSKDRSMVFVGYSGSDIDLFPAIADQERCERVFWFDPFASVEAQYIDRCAASRVNEMPSEFFRREVPHLIPIQPVPSRIDWDTVFSSAKQTLRSTIDIEQMDKVYILGICLHVSGDNKAACRVFGNNERALAANNNLTKTGTAQFYHARALDSVGKYVTAERLCGTMLRSLRRAWRSASSVEERDCLSSLMVRFYYERSFVCKQRIGPTIRYGDERVDWKPGYLAAMKVTSDCLVTMVRMRMRLMGLVEERNSIYRLHAWHAYLDHQVIFFSIVLGVLQTIGVDQFFPCRFLLLRFLTSIEGNARRFGDYFSLGNVGKYHIRIGD